MTTEGPRDGLSRRHALTGAALVSVGGTFLAGCGSESSSPGTGSSEAADGPTIDCRCHGSKFSAVDGSVVAGPAPSPLPGADVVVNGEDVEVDGEVVGAAADIPVGGGTIFPDQEVVVTQPEAGNFKAFSAVCTHQKCILVSVTP